ncbi:TauD/TfdA family dioxygenase [Caballeronia arationis]|uniref:TauD/TfdA family dioxygenase n=1 Tax=Caballeronia arationis TaxID=1777142 RepID=UPI001F2B37A7|nr:TauD/TfdA family dioxygenase [Caballeronia arationis]
METLFFLPWNRHSLCRGIRVLFAVESLLTLAWNIHGRSSTVAMWDNLQVQHYAVADYDNSPRKMLRATLAGTPLV